MKGIPFFCPYFLIILFSYQTFSNPLGWYQKKKVAKNVLDYAVTENNLSSKSTLYIITAHLKHKWQKDKATTIILKLHSFNGLSITSTKVTRIKLEPSKILFPINLSIGSYQNKILIVWQETNLGAQIGSRIKLLYSPNGRKNFLAIRELDDSKGSKTAILPRVIIDQRGKFHLFYQKETNSKKFTMFHSSGDGNSFSNITEVVDGIKDIGHGVFFPSVVMHNNQIEVFYQNRPINLDKDEIFYIRSTNNGQSFSTPTRLTNNMHNDFSPFAFFTQNKIEFVWQARLNNIWSIYHSAGGQSKKLTNVSTNSYSPNLIYIKKFGRVVTWHDFRENPSQIYAIFLDKQNIDTINKSHNVTKEKRLAKIPKLIKWKKSGYLFYLTGGQLYFKKIDSDTSKITIRSKTHLQNKSSKNTKGVFKLNIPRDPSGVSKIAWIQDQSPHSIPEVYNFSGLNRVITLNNLKSGNYYLHARYKDNIENESEVTHYNFNIDSEKPSVPIISSSTHKEKAQSINRNISLQFQAYDDNAIAYYEYVFSTNRADKFKKKVSSSNLVFTNVTPNIYFFKVRAVDLVGNYSKIGTYRIEIIYPEDNISLYTNLNSQQLRDSFFILEYLYSEPGAKLKQVYYVVDSKKVDPYKRGKVIIPEETSEGQRLLIPMLTYKKRRLYTISFGFDYVNGRKGRPRVYSFEYLGAHTIKKKSEIKKRIRDIISSKPKSKFIRENFLTAKISAKLLDYNNNLYEIFFSISNKKYKNKLKGYSWHLTGKPEIPDLDEINSTGGPEYVYQLNPGVYYLTVLPIFKNKVLSKKADYAYKRILVEEKYFLEGRLLIYGGGLLGLFFLGFGISQYRRIAFYINSFLKS